jgi:hypothetical protein
MDTPTKSFISDLQTKHLALREGAEKFTSVPADTQVFPSPGRVL